MIQLKLGSFLTFLFCPFLWKRKNPLCHQSLFPAQTYNWSILITKNLHASTQKKKQKQKVRKKETIMKLYFGFHFHKGIENVENVGTILLMILVRAIFMSNATRTRILHTSTHTEKMWLLLTAFPFVSLRLMLFLYIVHGGTHVCFPIVWHTLMLTE